CRTRGGRPPLRRRLLLPGGRPAAGRLLRGGAPLTGRLLPRGRLPAPGRPRSGGRPAGRRPGRRPRLRLRPRPGSRLRSRFLAGRLLRGRLPGRALPPGRPAGGRLARGPRRRLPRRSRLLCRRPFPLGSTVGSGPGIVGRRLLYGGLLRHHGRGPFTYCDLARESCWDDKSTRVLRQRGTPPDSPAPRTPRGGPACVVPSSPPGMQAGRGPRDRNPRGWPFGACRTGRSPEIRSAAVRRAPYTGRSEKRGWGRVAA